MYTAEKIRHCPIPFVIVGGTGTDVPCKTYEGATRIAYIAFLNIVVALIIVSRFVSMMKGSSLRCACKALPFPLAC